jgi:hypothetical protein
MAKAPVGSGLRHGFVTLWIQAFSLDRAKTALLQWSMLSEIFLRTSQATTLQGEIVMKVKLATKLCIIFLALWLTAAAWTTLGVTAAAVFAYIAWHNRPGNQDKVDWSLKGPGGFYVGGYMGGSMVHSQDFKFDNLTFPGLSSTSVTASTFKFAPGVVGGLKTRLLLPQSAVLRDGGGVQLQPQRHPPGGGDFGSRLRRPSQ